MSTSARPAPGRATHEERRRTHEVPAHRGHRPGPRLRPRRFLRPGHRGAAKPAPAGKVNINTATAQQLTALPGVGEKLAARIVEYRQKQGGFKNVSELMNVQGLGEKNLAKIQAYLTTGGDAAKPTASK